jgi:hypothetical protein
MWPAQGIGAGTGSEILYAWNMDYSILKKEVDILFPDFCVWQPLADPFQDKLCPQVWQRTLVDMRGDLHLCCGTDIPNCGNLFQEGDHWNNAQRVNMRREMLSDNKPIDLCVNCSHLGDKGI